VVLLASLSMLGALVGFGVWNWPGGRIFLGDGGAYLLGFWLAELGVLLVMRNPQVSPWFPLVIMIYPIWETLFSMYRRKIIRKHEVGHPDAMHLHQLVYQRVIRKSGAPGAITREHQRNSRVAPLLLIPVILLMLPALLLWHRTDAMLICAGAFCVAYGWLYYRLTHWRAPRWLIRA
jgi:UDP-N-acetylmuramyl pentapeptide phosphotransferase/UDP-N-acetylglucosamine-1-phosphate transferase